MKIDLIAGTRPNFVKIASLIHANEESGLNLDFRLIHTGQHYDENLSSSFFRQLDLPEPDHYFEIGKGSQAQQTGAIMTAYEKLLKASGTDLCLVVGDVTSSMAAAITAKKMGVKLAHIEAGIRSGDRSMPEEINRIIIDSIADFYFTTTSDASIRLEQSGGTKDNIFFVGNTMIDTLLRFKKYFSPPKLWNELDLQKGNYIVLTIHRAGNLEDPKKLSELIQAVSKNTKHLPIIFPIHPRTKEILDTSPFTAKNLFLTPPLSYLEFNYLIENSKAVVTDSGGISEETTILGIPCLTLRDSTERPETISLGTNELVGTNPRIIKNYLDLLLNGGWKVGQVPNLWDGKAGFRILRILEQL